MKKIFVILPNNLGDVIMTTPVLEGLKAAYPGCFIGFFVENGFEAGVENNPHCDKIVTFPRKEIRNVLSTPHWDNADNPMRAIIDRIVQEHFDWILNLCQHEYISYLIPLMKGKAVTGRYYRKEGNHACDDFWSQYLYAIPFSRKSNRLHASDVYRRIAGVTDHRGGYSIQVSALETVCSKEFLGKKGVNLNNKIMVFQPGAAFSSKCWPIEHFITLGRLLTQRGWQILITGAPSEAGRAKSIQEGIGCDSFSIAGETTFRQSIAACGLSQGCVTGDTAQMHAAAGLHVPVYALFGPTNPVETGPYGSGNWVFSGFCSDKPCFNPTCSTIQCMRSILPETLLSCIENGDPGNDPPCDVYTTAAKPNGDFMLMPQSAGAYPYVNEPDAMLSQNAFESDSKIGSIEAGNKALSLNETKHWLEIVEKMKDVLQRYVIDRDSNGIKEFELKKQTLAHFKGIGEFWTALLNIRLNSVPLLNPIEGIRKSAEACATTIQQLKNTLM